MYTRGLSFHFHCFTFIPVSTGPTCGFQELFLTVWSQTYTWVACWRSFCRAVLLLWRSYQEEILPLWHLFPVCIKNDSMCDSQGSSYQSCWWDDVHAQVLSSVLVSLPQSWGCAQTHSIYWYAMPEEPILTLAKDTSKNQSEWMRREWWSEVTTFPVHLLPLSLATKQEKQIHSPNASKLDRLGCLEFEFPLYCEDHTFPSFF